MSLESTSIDSSDTNENETDKSTFHEVCAKGNLKLVKVYLAQRGFDWNIEDNNGRTGFDYACRHGNLNVVQFLLEQGCDWNIGDNKGKTAFHYACIHGHFDVVQFLLQQKCDMNVGDNNGRTGFHFACFKGNLNVVQFLLEQGFDMDVAGNKGCTGFHEACIVGKLNVVQFLVQEGVDMNLGDNNGRTGFHDACFNGKLNVVQFLVQQGFEDINERVNGMNGLELLIYAHAFDKSDHENFLRCVLLLIEVGAELSEYCVVEELRLAVQNRIFEITFMKETIFQKWSGRIAQAITDFTIDSVTNTSLQNLSQFLD